MTGLQQVASSRRLTYTIETEKQARRGGKEESESREIS